MNKLYTLILAIRYRVNGLLLELYLLSLGCKVGKGLKCLRLPIFRDIPKNNITIGDRVTIGCGVIFEIPASGSLYLGNEVVIGDRVRLSSAAKIVMGNWSGIAENSSIRGSFHGLAKNTPYMKQSDVAEDIVIGTDVLIGANTQILMGATIPDGVVIGALSIVRRSDKIHSYGIFAGSPLKHIRDRQ